MSLNHLKKAVVEEEIRALLNQGMNAPGMGISSNFK